ncbi:hypothetical protein BDV98DRAFT_560334 [Pterulicium gracile]|uniref:DUF6593 domain-containing protein n=1 Tax=Pterulicium gracile TaxID=1884261 RepID=A0A5C3QYN4_9AGAR|nr:hypothetical protein BDV98DRAFT_560334 [Pterula gracilis]
MSQVRTWSLTFPTPSVIFSRVMSAPLPYLFEDRTGHSTASDWDDIYDRLYLRVAPCPTTLNVTNVYTMNQRASRHRDTVPFDRTPSVILDFNRKGGEYATVSFVQKQGPRAGSVSTVPLSKYLRKTSMFGGSLSRKFTASDGQEYRWAFRGGVSGREWTCTRSDSYLVAHFDLKPPNTRTYGLSSGNSLTVYEHYASLSIELLASLTLMRYIQEHNL